MRAQGGVISSLACDTVLSSDSNWCGPYNALFVQQHRGRSHCVFSLELDLEPLCWDKHRAKFAVWFANVMCLQSLKNKLAVVVIVQCVLWKHAGLATWSHGRCNSICKLAGILSPPLWPSGELVPHHVERANVLTCVQAWFSGSSCQKGAAIKRGGTDRISFSVHSQGQ